MIEERDPRRQVRMYAATQPGIHRRSGPLLRALAVAAGADAELRALWDEIESSRLIGQGRFVEMLEGRGALQTGLTAEEGRDILWTLCSLAVFDSLVTTLSWSVERYEAWLADALTCALLPEA
jgi:hypothetical protein